MKWTVILFSLIWLPAQAQQQFIDDFNLVNTAGTQYYKIMVDSIVLDNNYASWHTATRDAYFMARISDGADIVILHPPTITRVEYSYAVLDTIEVSPDSYESPLFYQFDWAVRQSYPITGDYTLDIIASSVADSVGLEIVCMDDAGWGSEDLTLLPSDGQINDQHIGFCEGDLQVVIAAYSPDKIYEYSYPIPLNSINEEQQ